MAHHDKPSASGSLVLAGGPGPSTHAHVTTSTRSRLRAIRDGVGAAVGAVLGIAPHVLHHVGLIAGAAVLTGAGGNALFYAIGLLFSIPMLRRIHRRFGTWIAPTIAVAVFSVMFLISAFIIGPALTSDSGAQVPAPTPVPTEQHSQHHT